jgi:cytoskeletal protein CcmA (bactofilin family)
MVDAFRVESRVLIECLQDPDGFERQLKPATTGVPERGIAGLVRLGILVTGMAAVHRAAFGFLGSLELPASLDWLDPTRTAGQMNLVVNAIAYVLLEGGSMMESILDSATVIALNLVGLAVITMLLRRSIRTTAMLSVIALMAVFSSSSYALDVRRAENQAVTVPQGETVDDTLVVFGDSINIDGTVNGDLITFARNVSIRGMVKGNVIGFGQHLTVEGIIEGSIFGVGQTVQNRGRVTNNVYGFGQDVTIGTGAEVTGNALLFAGETNVDGSIGHDLWIFCNRADVRGNVLRNVNAFVNGITVLAPARIVGDLTARVQRADNVRVESGATVGGKTDIQVRPPEPNRYATFSFYLRQIMWLAAAFVTGIILFWLFPALTQVNLDSARTLLTAAGIGFLAACATPIAAIIIAVTVIGLPIGLVTLALWLLGLYLAKIVLAGFLGRALLAGQGEQRPAPALMLLVGLVLVLIAVNLPYVGGIINFLLTLLGLGALILTLYRSYRRESLQPA